MPRITLSQCLVLLFLICGCGSKHSKIAEGSPLFELLASDHTQINFVNQLDENEEFNIIQYLYYYNGGGVATGDINNDGLADIYFSANQQTNRLYLNKGNFVFEDITESAGVAGTGDWSAGVTMADVNGDGWLDIYLCQVSGHKGLKGRNQLFVNQQNGQFKEQAAAFGLDFQGLSTQAAFFDYDTDGDLDVYLLNHSIHSTENYGNTTQRSNRDTLSGDRLYRNEEGYFRDVSEEAGIYGSKIGYGLGIAIGDINDDNCPDIYVSNDFHENDYLYYNNCDGTFTEGLTSSMGHVSTFSMGNDIADFNNDGRLDILTLDMKPENEGVLKQSTGPDPYNIYRYKLGFGYYYQYPRNMLQLNQGSLLGGKAVQFSEIGQLAGLAATDWSWAPLICDLDNDGWKDVFITNGIWRRPNDLDYLKYTSNQQIQQSATDLELASNMPSGKVPNYLFRNQKNLQFENVSNLWGLNQPTCSNGSAYADLDNDGDLDLVINNLNEKAGIFKNNSSKNHYLKISLKGSQSNPFGFGARVKLILDSLEITQELQTTKGFQSSSEPVLTVGLGKATRVKTLEIRWPDGTLQTFQNLEVNQSIMIEKEAGSGAGFPPSPEALFKNKTANTGLNFWHRENQFIDFDREKLMPHMLTTQGPGLAVADLNNDGWQDAYVGGAANQAGALYLQTSQARFELQDQPAFNMDRVHEDVDAIFFDANGDGLPDLYVVSGGGEWAGEVKAMRDRLYINDGTGKFSLAENAIPTLYANGACVQTLDYNEDGALDLFVGSRSIPGTYGLSPTSYLLENNGDGTFKDVTAEVLPDQGMLGMVTDVCLTDDKQLAIVGEWMPVTFLKFKNGKAIRSELRYSNGWWNCIYPADVDADGDMDLLLGNLGQNADLKASREEPVELYVGDFDGNGSTDPILTYYKQGKQYTYNSLDELFAQLISLRKKFGTYRGFSQSGFKEVIDPSFLKRAEKKIAYTFASSVARKNENGEYELKNLPIAAQTAPIFAFTANDFNNDGWIDILAAGNWFETQPGFGRYDASYGFYLKGNNSGRFSVIPPLESGFVVLGQSRNISTINQNTENPLILVGRNNERLLVFESQAPPKPDN